MFHEKYLDIEHGHEPTLFPNNAGLNLPVDAIYQHYSYQAYQQ